MATVAINDGMDGPSMMATVAINDGIDGNPLPSRMAMVAIIDGNRCRRGQNQRVGVRSRLVLGPVVSLMAMGCHQ